MGLNIRKIGTNEWHLDVRTRKAGQESRRREVFRGTKPQAEERFIFLKKELRFGATATNRKARTFGDLLEIYKEKKQPFTDKMQNHINQMQRELGGFDLKSFSERFESYLKILRTTPSARTKRPLSNGTLNHLVLMVKAVMNLAVNLEILDKNPVGRARFPMLKEVARDRVLTDFETTRLLNAVTEYAPHLRPVILYALQVPCRRTELINMRREDLDLFNNAIRIRNGTTKNNEGGWKPIPPDLIPYFRSIPAGSPFLFFRIVKGAYRSIGDFRKAWKHCLNMAGIPNFRFHDTRHISVTALLDNGTPEQTVMQVAGWKTPMFRTYYHIDGKKSMSLVRFNPGSGLQVDQPKFEAVKEG